MKYLWSMWLAVFGRPLMWHKGDVFVEVTHTYDTGNWILGIRVTRKPGFVNTLRVGVGIFHITLGLLSRKRDRSPLAPGKVEVGQDYIGPIHS